MQQSLPKKSLGQHWLHDDDSLHAMCEAAKVVSTDYVVEIGPGLGTLTEKLLQTGSTVRAVEYDDSLIPALKKKFANKDTFSIIQSDILRFDFSRLPAGYKVVANIPYYITSNLLRVMTETPNHFSHAALLVQKEVAERVAAEPGEMSILSVSVQLYCQVSLGMVVPAELFTPPPKVDSQILILKYRKSPLFENLDTEQFFRVVKAGFSSRRKKLRSSLSAGLQISKQGAEAMLVEAGIDPNLRAQALSLADWHSLQLALNKPS